MRLYPKSLAGRMILLTLLAILVAQLLSVWIFADERRFAVRAIAHDQTLSHAAALVSLLEASPIELQDQIIASSRNPNFRPELSDEPAIARKKPKHWIEKDLIFKLAEQTDFDLTRLRIRLYRERQDWLDWRYWKARRDELEHRDFLKHRWDDDDDHDDDKDKDKDKKDDGDEDHKEDRKETYKDIYKDKNGTHPRPDFPLSREFSLSIHLNNGQWLNIHSFVKPPSPLWALPSTVALLIMGLAISVIVNYDNKILQFCKCI